MEGKTIHILALPISRFRNLLIFFNHLIRPSYHQIIDFLPCLFTFGDETTVAANNDAKHRPFLFPAAPRFRNSIVALPSDLESIAKRPHSIISVSSSSAGSSNSSSGSSSSGASCRSSEGARQTSQCSSQSTESGIVADWYSRNSHSGSVASDTLSSPAAANNNNNSSGGSSSGGKGSTSKSAKAAAASDPTATRLSVKL